jgi:hypothetical protein
MELEEGRLNTLAIAGVVATAVWEIQVRWTFRLSDTIKRTAGI